MRSQNSSWNFGSEGVGVVVEHNPCREYLNKNSDGKYAYEECEVRFSGKQFWIKEQKKECV